MMFKNDVDNCIAILAKGGTILYPTDTVWGIGCDAENEAAVEKIYALKKRGEAKSMIILVAEEAQLRRYTNEPSPVIFDFIKGVQKPTTVIYEDARNLARNVIAGDGSVGIRVVKDAFCAALINRLGRAIVSTSSNISGYPPPAFFQDIDVTIKNGVDYIVQHRQDDMTAASPSTVVKLARDGSIEVLRP